jgi:hypothetical protein
MFRWYWQSEKAIKVYNTGRCDFWSEPLLEQREN